jgi:prepilin-type N-terminal cleavage/methylation domain-containing protein
MQRMKSEQGFTFLEVIVALALLAVSASILIGMEAAAVRRTIRDQNAQQATLVARRIMASIEAIDDKDFNLASSEGRPVEELLQELGVDATTQPLERGAQASPPPLTASLLVEDQPIPLPNTVVDPMKRVTLKVSWGPGRDDFITIFYLRNGPR